ncbi:DUF481 domain-containing protein [Flavobacterium supellecticarium]|uniref:DUF481 domain-containing protein n=1 Tax=Flavobacterium supellecticarium TaxID=2565924 RepID=A0A4S3ZUH2_9FLAO|nr:outer membrane beta-barrel protein [Flavobacterium supellecticarium]THF49427.1 DUF481 domain-containing protein [Flavobacterium supellecticarium]
MILRNTILLFVLLGSLCCFSQSEPLKTVDTVQFRSRLGIGISNFINSAFSSDKNAYNLEYRYALNKKYALRAGASYEKDDSEGGFTEIGLKIGADKVFRQNKHWTFYFGADILSSYSNFKNVNKDNYAIGIAPLLGIQYNIVDNFSISIEPMLYFKYNIVVDNATFLENKRTTWSESGFGKTGYIQLNFHF